MVASAKRFVAKPEFRIELDDLAGDEVRRMEQALSDPDFSVSDTYSTEKVVQHIERYEGLTEALARIVGIMGRWGDGAEFKLVTDILTQFGVRERTNGFTQLINLRTYPAVLSFYAYGLGLLSAQRFTDLFKLFSHGLMTQNDQRVPIADQLLLQSWPGNRDDTFKLLPGRHQSRTALSDHLHNLFKAWSSDMTFLEAGYTRLFEEFEMLGSLANITLKTTKPALMEKITKQDFIWCPMGRACWDGRTYRAIAEHWRDEEVIKSLLHAGFANRDRDFFTLALNNLQRVAGSTGW
jgi:hypothetical protein